MSLPESRRAAVEARRPSRKRILQSAGLRPADPRAGHPAAAVGDVTEERGRGQVHDRKDCSSVAALIARLRARPVRAAAPRDSRRSPGRAGRTTAFERARAEKRPARPARSRRRVVPLVPRDGRDDLSGPEGRPISIARHFVAMRVDQDSRPDLSNRYEDYGWPATIIFDANGLRARQVRRLHPPGADAVAARGRRRRIRRRGRPRFPRRRFRLPDPRLCRPACARISRRSSSAATTGTRAAGDFRRSIWTGTASNTALARGERGADAERDAKMARETLEQSRQLIDPVWGGLDQYSDSGDWDHPHFEKLLQFQAEGIRLYAGGLRAVREPGGPRRRRATSTATCGRS